LFKDKSVFTGNLFYYWFANIIKKIRERETKKERGKEYTGLYSGEID